jgi:hypothetical protein
VCQDHFPSLPRRSFLRGAGVLAGGVLLSGHAPAASATARPHPERPGRPVDPWGYRAWSNAMHIHSSFSEQTASMQAQLYQATLNSVDVLWWTEHDWRLDGKDFWLVDNFTSLKGPPSKWRKPGAWVPRETGPNGPGSGGGIVTTPCSPNDPVRGGALRVSAQSTSSELATYGYDGSSQQYRDNLSGQSLSIDVMLEPRWAHGYLEIRVGSSYHLASGGRPAGTYTLSYRLTPSGTARRAADGCTGVVVIPVVADGQTWTTVTVTPSQDIAALWPDLDRRDFSCYSLGLYAASSSRKTVTGYFDYLRFNRTLDGGELFAQQGDMMREFAPQFPAVTQQQGLEVSLGWPHINWFGPNITVPAYDGPGSGKYAAWVEQHAIPMIHQAGGLCAWNHPFGTSFTTAVLPQSQQHTLLRRVASQLLPASLYGADIIEVGYPERAGVDLAHHVALWDILSRNAVFVTGNGTSDDHWGTDWAGLTWNWVTSTWAASTAQSDLLTALSAGRAYCGSLPAPPVALDMLVDGQVPMGAVSVSSLASRSLTLTAAGLPSGWTLALMQGAVDYAGTSALESNAKQVGSFRRGDLDGKGQARVRVDTSASSYLRTEVMDPKGNTQALSNPVWLLDAAPPKGIPPRRQA